MTPTNTFLEYVFGDSLFSQTIFEKSRPTTIAQSNASQSLITLLHNKHYLICLLIIIRIIYKY